MRDKTEIPRGGAEGQRLRRLVGWGLKLRSAAGHSPPGCYEPTSAMSQPQQAGGPEARAPEDGGRWGVRNHPALPDEEEALRRPRRINSAASTS